MWEGGIRGRLVRTPATGLQSEHASGRVGMAQRTHLLAGTARVGSQCARHQRLARACGAQQQIETFQQYLTVRQPWGCAGHKPGCSLHCPCAHIPPPTHPPGGP